MAAQRALPWPASSLLEFPLHKVALAAGQPAAREVLQDRMCGEVTSRHMNVALCGFVVLRVPIGHPAFIQAWADERLMEEKTLAPRNACSTNSPTTFHHVLRTDSRVCGSMRQHISSFSRHRTIDLDFVPASAGSARMRQQHVLSDAKEMYAGVHSCF